MSDELTLRPVRLSDAFSLQQNCWPGRPLTEVQAHLSRLLKWHEKGRGWGLVSLIRSRIIGFGQLTLWGRRAEICNLVVSERWRGRGAGTALIRGLLKIAREQGIPEVEIGAAVSNPRALALYRRLGFHDRYRMLLDLGNGPELVIYLSLRPGDGDSS